MSVVKESIADRMGDRGLADVVVPFLDRHLAGQDRGSVSVAIFDDFEQITTFGFAQRHQSPVVEDEHIDLGEPGQEPGIGSVDVH